MISSFRDKEGKQKQRSIEELQNFFDNPVYGTTRLGNSTPKSLKSHTIGGNLPKIPRDRVSSLDKDQKFFIGSCKRNPVESARHILRRHRAKSVTVSPRLTQTLDIPHLSRNGIVYEPSVKELEPPKQAFTSMAGTYYPEDRRSVLVYESANERARRKVRAAAIDKLRRDNMRRDLISTAQLGSVMDEMMGRGHKSMMTKAIKMDEALKEAVAARMVSEDREKKHSSSITKLWSSSAVASCVAAKNSRLLDPPQHKQRKHITTRFENIGDIDRIQTKKKATEFSSSSPGSSDPPRSASSFASSRPSDVVENAGIIHRMRGKGTPVPDSLSIKSMFGGSYSQRTRRKKVAAFVPPPRDAALHCWDREGTLTKERAKGFFGDLAAKEKVRPVGKRIEMKRIIGSNPDGSFPPPTPPPRGKRTNGTVRSVLQDGFFKPYKK
ncbi:hypothetical protein ADUPG1_013739 [Aduncisulcus paluster]|uniref:Uncharacterized protein n=1 Tax=Aduncisulcus paluster TaxID=2918883 RepID=A0ABQ5K3X8_9EUKA|nr:hypothetical protein ADUPG1_013739 [Aduncisulcus paluster]